MASASRSALIMQRNQQGPFVQDETRQICARLHHASNELQLRIESRRFETAQLQLQVQLLLRCGCCGGMVLRAAAAPLPEMLSLYCLH